MTLVLAGFATGLLVGLTGVGGGSLLTPLLLIFGMAPLTAVGTDLWVAAATKVVATRVHQSGGLIDWQVVLRLWSGSVPASGLMFLLMKAGIFSLQIDVFRNVIAVVVLLTALILVLQKRLHALGERFRLTELKTFETIQPVLTVAAGVILGSLVTLTSIGAGALGAVILMYLYPLRLTPSRLIATDIAHAIPLTLIAGFGHFLLGHVDFDLMGQLLLGSVPGVLLGAVLSSRLPQKMLRGLLAVVLTGVAVRLWW